MDTIYFAAKTGSELGKALKERVERYQRDYQAHPIYDLQRRSYLVYYGLSVFGNHLSSNVTPAGEQGEMAVATANLFKEMLTHIAALTTSQRPDFDPLATNTDAKSISQTVLAGGLLDAYMAQKGLEDLLREAVVLTGRSGEAFIQVGWDANAGEEYGVDEGEEPPPEDELAAADAAPGEIAGSSTGGELESPGDPVNAEPAAAAEEPPGLTGAPVREGDLSFKLFSTEDVIRDAGRKSFARCNWVILRHRDVNKYDLAARYREHADEILAVAADADARLGFKEVSRTESDDISLYEFLHERSDACPNGSQVLFTADGLILFEGPLPYRNTQVIRMSAGDWDGCTWGYSSAFDLLGLQRVHGLVYSTIVTNLKNTGVSSVIMRPDSNVEMSGKSGMRIIEAAQGQEPQPFNLTAIPGDAYQLLEITEKLMEAVSGANSVVRGDPDAQIKSGAYAALIQQQALTFTGQLQASYTRALEQVGTAAIRTLRDFASAPRVAAIVGKAGASMLKEFTGDDLSQVDRVTVQVGNPMTRTQAGRLELANMLLQMGKNEQSPIKSSQDLIAVLTSGRLDVATEDITRQQQLIRRENERLAEGLPVQALITDLHRAHIQQHLSELDSPEVREDPVRVEGVLAHVQEHIRLGQQLDPLMAEATGQDPFGLPPPAPPGGPPPGGPPPPPAGGDVQAGSAVIDQQPQLPEMPINPATGAEWTPEDGGAGLPQ